MLPSLRPARLKITLKDGRVLSAEALTNKGDTEDPYSATEVEEKFHEVTGPIWNADHRAAILSAVDGLTGAADIRALSRLLAV
jgi:2-methylcitrate dehydratase PrpD